MTVDWAPLVCSLRIALAATVLSVFLGVPAAWYLSRRKLRARPLWEGIAALPLVMPPTVLGYYLLVSFGRPTPLGRLYTRLTGSDLVFTWQGASAAVCLVAVPLLIRTAQVSMMAVDASVLDAARIDGASEGALFRIIVLPLARRGIFSGIGLAFSRALGDFGVTLMVGGNIAGAAGTRTMSLEVYSALNAGDDRTAIVYVLILSAITFAFSIGASYSAHAGD